MDDERRGVGNGSTDVGCLLGAMGDKLDTLSLSGSLLSGCLFVGRSVKSMKV